MRSTQFAEYKRRDHDVTARELEATWRFADTTPRVDAARMRLTPIPQHDKQPTFVNHAKRYRAARKAKLATQVT